MSSSGERTHLKLLTVGEFARLHRPRVRAHIGGGGMADVFRATDEELTGAP